MSSNILKQKVVYLGGFLSHKFKDPSENEENISAEFISVLNHGGLHVPILSTVYFVHCAINVHNELGKSRQNCCKYFRRLLSFIDAPMAQNRKACQSLTNILFKAFTLDVCDTEKQIGCLRRKQKLAV